MNKLDIVLAGTGHRSNKLFYKNQNGYHPQTKAKLQLFIEDKIKILKPTKIISGMALGFDTALALASLDLNIPLIAAVPFDGQELIWPEESKKTYREILSQASEVKIISPGPYKNYKLQTRNEWMVDNCNVLLALYDGSKGGTYNCLKYASTKLKVQINLWDEWINYE